MIQDIAPHVYENQFSAAGPVPGDVALVFGPEGLLCRVEDGALVLPALAELPPAGALTRLFSVDGRGYFLWEGQPPAAPAGYDYRPTRPLRDLRPDETLFALGAGESLRRWYEANRFCGHCGTPMAHGTSERSQVCPRCGQTVYPKICPAIIAAVYDGDRLLLTRYRGRPFTRYALVAGFNEIGESIEDTVRREVMEEVGLRVKNLRFYKSQPWVFTDSLLMGFFAQLDGPDAITLQEDELSEAAWFDRRDIPADHSGISLTGEMIEYFRAHGAPAANR